MAIPLIVPLSLRTGIPYSIVRKRKYGLPGEVQITQVTGYSNGGMYINGIRKGDRIVLLDDVISTGGTLRSLIDAFDKMGVNIVDIMVAIEKGNGKEKLERDTGRKIRTLVKVEVRDGKACCPGMRAKFLFYKGGGLFILLLGWRVQLILQYLETGEDGRGRKFQMQTCDMGRDRRLDRRGSRKNEKVRLSANSHNRTNTGRMGASKDAM